MTKFDANLYSAFLENKTTKQENEFIMEQMSNNQDLILKLNLASAILYKNK